MSQSATLGSGYQIDDIDGIPFLSFPTIKELENFCCASKLLTPSEKCVVGKCEKLNFKSEKCDYAPSSPVSHGDEVYSTVVKNEGKSS